MSSLENLQCCHQTYLLMEGIPKLRGAPQKRRSTSIEGGTWIRASLADPYQTIHVHCNMMRWMHSSHSWNKYVSSSRPTRAAYAILTELEINFPVTSNYILIKAHASCFSLSPRMKSLLTMRENNMEAGPGVGWAMLAFSFLIINTINLASFCF